MEYRKLGRTGLEVSALCLGTMQFGWTADEGKAAEVMDAFVAAGGNFIDTADVYSRWHPGNPGGVSEEIIGRWLQQRGNRRQVVLATKVRGRMWDGPNGEGLSRAHIIQACEDSLRRLQTDWIDLYQTHWYDAETPIEETLRALDDLVRAGKVRYIGCSNLPAWRLTTALWQSDKLGLARYDALQPHYSLVHRAEFEREMADLCREQQLGVIPYSPLAGGFLTGKYRRDQPFPADSLLATRRLGPAAMVLCSLLAGVLLTVGGAAHLDVRLNFLNFVALPLTFGIGVEYAMNLYDRVEHLGDVGDGLRSVGGAVSLCSLTTIIGYGSLLVADNQALQSFGYLAVAGELACSGTAMFLLPSAMVLVQRRRERSK